MRRKRRHGNDKCRGFSLLEMMVAMAVMLLIMGAIFEQLNIAQRTAAGEEVRLETFQEAREFMDQMTRDLRATGYPNSRNFDSSIGVGGIRQYKPENAVGLVLLDAGNLWFESSIDGTGTVRVIRFKLNTCNGVPCLVRSQTDKQLGDPVSGQSESYQTQVENVLNGTEADPIFIAYDKSGNAVAPPGRVAITDTGSAMVNINSIAVKMVVRSSRPDPRTGEHPTVTLLSTVKLNNCTDGLYTGASIAGCR